MKPLESLVRAFVEVHPEDAARAFETLEPTDAGRLLKNLPLATVSEILDRLSPEIAVPLLEEVEGERAGKLLSELSPRAAAVLLRRLSPERRDATLANLPPHVARPLRDLFAYSEQTAGGIMEPHVASFSVDLTAQQVIAKIRKTQRDILHYLYVTDRGGKLIGVVSMRDLLLAKPTDPIEPFVRRKVVAVPGTHPREEAVTMMREHGFVALPVVDFEGRLIGVIKHEDALLAGQMEAFEDMQLSVGAGADERALSTVSTVVKSRFPWLLVNLVTAFAAATVIGLFEGMIAKIAALAVLLPVVAGQGGNTGSQSLAVVMRGLALREIIAGAKKKVVIKEAVAGLINGVGIAIVTAACVFAWRWLAKDTMQTSVGLSAVIFLAMIINMVVAATAGAAIPLALKALGRDPAQSGAIFLTTVTDVIGFAAFLGLAALYLQLFAAAGEKVSLPTSKKQPDVKCLALDTGDAFSFLGTRQAVDAENQPYFKTGMSVVNWARPDPRVIVPPRDKYLTFADGEWRMFDELPEEWSAEVRRPLTAPGVAASREDAALWTMLVNRDPLHEGLGATVFLHHAKSGYAIRDCEPTVVE